MAFRPKCPNETVTGVRTEVSWVSDLLRFLQIWCKRDSLLNHTTKLQQEKKKKDN